jgi:hypothetical protein
MVHDFGRSKNSVYFPLLAALLSIFARAQVGPVRISVLPANSFTFIGDTSPMTATWSFLGRGASSDITQEVVWTSSDKTIATIDSSGTVMAVSRGTVTITGTRGPFFGSTTITVVPTTSVKTIAVQPPSPSVPNGAPQMFTATATFADNSTQDVTWPATWSSSNQAVAVVNGPGKIGTIVAGTSTIAAAFESVSGSTQLTVTHPILNLSQSAVNFSATFGGSAPLATSVNVSNTGTGVLSFTAVSDVPWLHVSPTNGTAPQALQVSSTIGTMISGNYAGHIYVIAQYAQGSPGVISVQLTIAAPPPSNAPFWAQWGANPQHTGAVPVAGQALSRKLAAIVYDPFTAQEEAEAAPLFNGEPVLLVHYQAPLIDGNDVYIMMKTGTYVSCNPVGAWQQGAACGPNTWNTQIWNESRFTWENEQLVHVWDFPSDWKPEPDKGANDIWEPVFHAVEANDFVYVPGAGGTIWKVKKTDGTAAAHIDPFAGTSASGPNTYVAGPLSADSAGNIYYNVMQLDATTPWQSDVLGAWLVKVTPQDASSTVTYKTLVPNAPAGYGSARAGINLAPAIAPNGTIYTVSRAHRSSTIGYINAVNPDLTFQRLSSLQSVGGIVIDQASSSPTVAPDGSVLYGAGLLVKLDTTGEVIATYGAGWDTTPGIYFHNSGYAVLVKENQTQGPNYITQLGPGLQPEWQFENTTIDPGAPYGHEWCINMPAIDVNGMVYVNNEDGNIYALPQGHSGIFTVPAGKLFLNSAVGAAYTPLTIGPDGKLYTQNNGIMFVVGN